MAREYFCAYHSMIKPMQKLSDAERGRLFMALLQHSAGDTPINLQGREEIAFEIYADQIDRDREAYEAKCKVNRTNGEKANGTERPRTVPNAPQEKEKGKGEEEGKEKDDSSSPSGGLPPHKKFAPPTVEDVAAYCRERRNGVDAERFCAYYQANGWKVGRNPMKDWKAAVRTWERDDSQPKANKATPKCYMPRMPKPVGDEDLDRLLAKFEKKATG